MAKTKLQAQKNQLEKDLKQSKADVHKLIDQLNDSEKEVVELESALKVSKANENPSPTPFTITIKGQDLNNPNNLESVILSGVSKHHAVIALKMAVIHQEIQASQA